MRLPNFCCLMLVLLLTVGEPRTVATEPAPILLPDFSEKETPEQETPSSETAWSNLQRLPTGAVLLIEHTDGKRHKGRLLSTGDDAISVRRRTTTLGVSRCRVARVWLLGDREVGKGALAGLVAGATFGAILGGTHHGDEPAARFAVALALGYGGIGAGIGAAMGATVRERTLVYRTSTLNGDCGVQAAPAPRGLPPASLDSLPPPVRNVYRRFSAEKAVQELAAQD
jgi:hypothetical protein